MISRFQDFKTSRFQDYYKWIFSSLMVFGVFLLGYKSEQSSFGIIFSSYTVLFVVYAFIFWLIKSEKDILFFLGLGVILRMILVIPLPHLSDDVYRFIWDGRLWLNGINPFTHLPSYYIENQISLIGIDGALYEKLNSPKYFTIYPPVHQLSFYISAYLFPNSIYGNALVLKMINFLFELTTIFYLWKILVKERLIPNVNPKNIILYVLNPLILIELVGNLHFEAAMICFLTMALYYFLKHQNHKSAILFALSIASKLLPLMFLPFIIKRIGWKKSFVYFSIIGVLLILMFFPLYDPQFVANFGSSLNLYFQRFEFNASFYYISRWIGYQIYGWNKIQDYGPLLSMITPIGIGIYFLWERKPENFTLPVAMLFAFTLYLSMATIIHPWYTALPILFAAMSRFRYPIIWSYLITLTYINYSYPSYQENLWIVGFEYIVVYGYLIWELRQSNQILLNHPPNHNIDNQTKS